MAPQWPKYLQMRIQMRVKRIVYCFYKLSTHPTTRTKKTELKLIHMYNGETSVTNVGCVSREWALEELIQLVQKPRGWSWKKLFQNLRYSMVLFGALSIRSGCSTEPHRSSTQFERAKENYKENQRERKSPQTHPKSFSIFRFLFSEFFITKFCYSSTLHWMLCTAFQIPFWIFS